MRGVPVICSDACGAALAVRGSKRGGVFPKGDAQALKAALSALIRQGPLPPEERKAMAQWAIQSFSAASGAAYLTAILKHLYEGAPRPQAPWDND